MKTNLFLFLKIILLLITNIVFSFKKDQDKEQATCGKASGYVVEFCKQVDNYKAGFGKAGKDVIHVDCIVRPAGTTVSNQTNGTYYCSGTYKLTTYDDAEIYLMWGGTTNIECELFKITKGEGNFSIKAIKESGGEGNIYLRMSSGSSWMFSTALDNNCNQE
jgi:hypothetical protein